MSEVLLRSEIGINAENSFSQTDGCAIVRAERNFFFAVMRDFGSETPMPIFARSSFIGITHPMKPGANDGLKKTSTAEMSGEEYLKSPCHAHAKDEIRGKLKSRATVESGPSAPMMLVERKSDIEEIRLPSSKTAPAS